jgi:hypothetical protein
MGEGLVIRTSIASAKEILKVIKDPKLLFWEDGGHHLDVMAKWLPKKGFKILPKFFDKNYVPGAVGDDGDNFIRSDIPKRRKSFRIDGDTIDALVYI